MMSYSEVRSYNPRGIALCLALQELQDLDIKSEGIWLDFYKNQEKSDWHVPPL